MATITQDVTVVIPCKNEATSIGKVVTAIKTLYPQIKIIVMSDGSTDSTAQVVHKLGVEVVESFLSLGYGGAIKQGIGLAHTQWILILDGDSTYNPNFLIDFILDATPGSMTVGRRFTAWSGNSILHRVGRWTINLWASICAGQRVLDVNSGMRIFEREFFYSIPRELVPDGFSLTTTLTMMAHQLGHGVRYIPIIYNKRTGRSKVQRMRGVINILKQIHRLRHG